MAGRRTSKTNLAAICLAAAVGKCGKDIGYGWEERIATVLRSSMRVPAFGVSARCGQRHMANQRVF